MTGSSETSFKRKKVLINRPLQLFIIGYFLLNGILCVLITYTMVKISYNNTLSELMNLNSLSLKHFAQIMEHQSSYYNKITLGLLGLISVTFFLGGLYLSHRIAGPIYHLQKHLRTLIKEDKYEEMHFRKSDFLKDLEDDFNNYMRFKRGEKVEAREDT